MSRLQQKPGQVIPLTPILSGDDSPSKSHSVDHGLLSPVTSLTPLPPLPPSNSAPATQISLGACMLSRGQFFATPWTAVYQAPLSMECSSVFVSSSRISSPLRDQTRISRVSCIGRRILHHWATWDTLTHVLVVVIQPPSYFRPLVTP